MAKRRSTLKKVKIIGPSLVIDGVEMVGFSTEFSAQLNLRKFSEKSLNGLALKLHQQFANAVNEAVQEADADSSKVKARESSKHKVSKTSKPSPGKSEGSHTKKTTASVSSEEGEDAGSGKSAASRI